MIGRKEILDQFPPGSMTSTHSGNAICCAAALASLKVILKENLVERAAKTGAFMQEAAAKIHQRFKDVILAHQGKGLVASLQCVKPGGTEPDGHLAWQVIGRAVQSGVMLFAPVGFGGASVKIAPPLVISQEALAEAMNVIEESFAQVLEQRRKIKP